MSAATATAATVRTKTRRAASDGWAEQAGRVGLATRGLLYAIVAWLAIDVARGHNHKTDSKGALAAIAHQPLGRVLVLIVAVGLAAFAVWSAIGIVVRDGTKKLSRAGRMVIYAGLCVFAFTLVMGQNSNGGSDTKETDGAARLLTWPGGRWIVAAIGIGILAGGVVNIRKAVTGRWKKALKRQPTTARARRLVAIAAVT